MKTVVTIGAIAAGVFAIAFVEELAMEFAKTSEKNRKKVRVLTKIGVGTGTLMLL